MHLYKDKKTELLTLQKDSPESMDEMSLQSEICTFLRQVVKQTFTTRLLSIVDDLSRSYLPASHSSKAPAMSGGRTHSDVFPKRAGIGNSNFNITFS